MTVIVHLSSRRSRSLREERRSTCIMEAQCFCVLFSCCEFQINATLPCIFLFNNMPIRRARHSFKSSACCVEHARVFSSLTMGTMVRFKGMRQSVGSDQHVSSVNLSRALSKRQHRVELLLSSTAGNGTGKMSPTIQSDTCFALQGTLFCSGCEAGTVDPPETVVSKKHL